MTGVRSAGRHVDVVLFVYALYINENSSPLDFLWPLAMLSLLVWTIATSLVLVRQVGRRHTVAGA